MEILTLLVVVAVMNEILGLGLPLRNSDKDGAQGAAPDQAIMKANRTLSLPITGRVLAWLQYRMGRLR